MYKLNQLIQLSIELGRLKAANDVIGFYTDVLSCRINDLEEKIEILKIEIIPEPYRTMLLGEKTKNV